MTASTPRAVKAIHPALRDDIADLTTHRALPTAHIDMLDPFLFLNHHGPQTYAPGNRGLPFGPHPHRGFETVTFILEGDIAHRDSGGHESVIDAGGVQWMTAGRGLVHSETSSDRFKAQGGPLEVLQLWLNLPARLKMTAPRYTGLQRAAIPEIAAADGVRISLAAGAWDDARGPFDTLTDVTAMTIAMAPGARLDLPVASDRTVFFYVVRGAVKVGGTVATARRLVEFSAARPVDAGGAAPQESIAVEAVEAVEAVKAAEAANAAQAAQPVTPALILFCHAPPLREPVVSYGPFVMNTREEIGEAIADYQAGRFDA